MAEATALWDLLRQAAQPAVADALKAAVESAPDRALNRVNPLAFASAHGLDEEATIGGLVHAAQLGIFDMSWNMLCPGCGGVLESGAALKTLGADRYYCSFCAMDTEPTLDEVVEVTFTVNPRLRRIAAHDPNSLPLAEYMRQIFWSSGTDLPEDIEGAINKNTLDLMDLAPGEKAAMSLTLPNGFVIAFDPVSHTSLFLEISGEEAHERRSLSVVFADSHAHHGTTALRPGPVRITFENKSGRRALPGLWVHGPFTDALASRRRPFLTATRLLSNQTFRDLYRSGTFDPEQRFKITSLTILFTDLGGRPRSTTGSATLPPSISCAAISASSSRRRGRGRRGGEDDRRRGDGDLPDARPRAALSHADARGHAQINEQRGSEDLALNIGLHEGPCLAVMLDERQDYFGQTVNIAARVQDLAEPSAILATKPVLESADVARLVGDAGYRTASKQLSLRGVSEAFEIYEIREGKHAAQAA